MAVTLATTPRDRLDLGYNGTGFGVCGYNGQPYDATNNPGGMDGNGVAVNWINMCADIVSCGLTTANDASLAAAAASQQEAWGPTFTTAAGTVTFLTATTFSAAGDVAATFPVGSHVAADCGADGYRYGLVSGVSSTTVTVSLFAGVLTANLRRVYNAETKALYLSDYIDLTAAVSSARASQDAALASKNAAAGSAGEALASQNAAASQSFRDLRDTLGACPGIIRPTLNLHAGLVTSDDCPLGTFSRSSAKWRLGPTGLLESVAAGKVAREWDANGDLLGWLIEGQCTNRVVGSEDWTTANVTGAGTVTANAVNSPAGTLTMDMLSDNDASVTSAYFDKYITIPNDSAPHALSIFLRKGTASVSTIQAFLVGGTAVIGQMVTVDLSAGTSSGGKLTRLPDGSYRLEFKITNNGSGNTSAILRVFPAGSNAGVTGTVYAWGVQVEDGEFSTSYIPTTDAPVTRPADVWTIPTSSFPFNVYSGAFYVQGLTAKALPKSGIGQVLFMIDDGTWQNTIFMYRSSTGVVWLSTLNNGVNVGINCGTFANSTIVRAAVSYNASLIRVSINGGNVLSVAYSRPNGVSMLRLGNDLALSQAWNGELLHFSYLPQEQSDANMKMISL